MLWEMLKSFSQSHCSVAESLADFDNENVIMMRQKPLSSHLSHSPQILSVWMKAGMAMYFEGMSCLEAASPEHSSPRSTSILMWNFINNITHHVTMRAKKGGRGVCYWVIYSIYKMWTLEAQLRSVFSAAWQSALAFVFLDGERLHLLVETLWLGDGFILGERRGAVSCTSRPDAGFHTHRMHDQSPSLYFWTPIKLGKPETCA